MHIVAEGPLAARRTQCGVQHRPALGVVDGLARKHRITSSFDVAFPREVEQKMQRRDVDAVLRQVGKDLWRLDREGVEAARVAREGVAQVEVTSVGFVVAAQRGPGFGLVAAECFHQSEVIILSSLAASAANARMPSASFSVAIASSFKA